MVDCILPNGGFKTSKVTALLQSCWLFYALLLPLNSQAQKFNFINYHVEDGLIQSQATSFVQDVNHELWVGTFGAVSRFDGTHFVNYNKANGLSDNMVTDLLRDQNGHIWIATSAGVSRYDGQGMHQIRFPKGVVPAQVQKIVSDGGGTIWCLMEGKLYYYQQGQFVPENTYDQITAMTIDKMGKLWIHVYHQGIFLWDKKGWIKEIAFLPDAGNLVYYMLFGTYSGTLYCLTDEGIKVAEQGALHTPEWVKGLPSRHSVIKIIETTRGEIWVSMSDGGAWKFDRKKWIHYTFKNGMADDLVHDFFEDVENNIWIATNGNGIFRYGGGLFSYFDLNAGLTAPGIMSIVQNTAGTTFFGGNTAGLYQLSKDGQLEKMDMSLGDNKVNTLLVDPQDRL